MLKVALIGCGKIGSRHLQSLIKINIETEIYIVDTIRESINISLNLVENDLKENQKITLKVCSEIDEIPTGVDFAIIASDSKPRFNILKNLLKKRTPKFLILEKLLFTKKEEFSEALKKDGVEVIDYCFKHLPHSFLIFGRISKAIQEANNRIANDLAKIIKNTK